jgi:hypothetical protein
MRADSSKAAFVLETNLPKGATAGSTPPTTVFRINFYDQFGLDHDESRIIKGCAQCQATGFGPPNINGRVLMNCSDVSTTAYKLG